MQSPDERAIRALYEQVLEGWNQGNATAFAAPLAPDVDFIAFDGSHFKGREAVIAFHDPVFKTHLRGTRLIGAVTSVRFLSPTIALVHGRGGTIMRGQTKASRARDSIHTMVAVRDGERWSFASFQNTRERPIGRTFAGTMHWLIGDFLWKLVPRAGTSS